MVHCTPGTYTTVLDVPFFVFTVSVTVPACAKRTSARAAPSSSVLTETSFTPGLPEILTEVPLGALAMRIPTVLPALVKLESAVICWGLAPAVAWMGAALIEPRAL